ncbi:MAG TPA: rod-binding protein [Sphingobium sp.]|uniref:rod-binding protein n=1 Tax=Sphingobium sp. TaxID=1912891 RepID=UPI002ED04CE2
MAASPLSMVDKPGIASSSALAGSVNGAQDIEKLKKAAKGFEAVFTRKLMSSMRSAGFGDELTGSSAVDQFQEMSDAKTADNLSERGTFGIADMLLKQLAPQHAATYAANAAGQGTGATTATAASTGSATGKGN